ncbi:DUF6415 family natural product biosynthesis protein [Streptomyces sp. NPDC059479]|uniref:DUF6415 family natural product biosynthesis protein n=1 Tax=Streptomyces sp. NPDC059479 TaxID=3346848 RepID=UPI0036896234
MVRGHLARLGSEPGSRAELREDLAELRGHIASLLPSARQRANRVGHGSPEWYSLTTRLDRIEEQAERKTLGEGTLGAHVQVRRLALDCAWLLRYSSTEAAR